MADVQIENGYTRIANELLEHLCFAGISGSEYRILIFVIRKTYGFKKLKDKISLTQFQKGTGMKGANTSRTLKELLAKRLLLKENNLYGINKNWEQWGVAKRLNLSNRITSSSQTDKKTSSQTDVYKRKSKETYTKERGSSFGAEKPKTRIREGKLEEFVPEVGWV